MPENPALDDTDAVSPAGPAFDDTVAISSDSPAFDDTVAVSSDSPALDDTVAVPSDNPGLDDTFAAKPDVRVRVEKGALIGRYIVISRLGAGAMGVVYAAFDPQLDRKVAIKLLKTRHGDLGMAQVRLQREAQSLAKLDHPNVVSVFDVGIHEGQLFVAMEFVDGQTLGAWMRESDSPRPWQEVLEVFIAAGRGLAAAHAVGMIHRDFKPDNVMLGKDARVRVMDFGIARSGSDTDLGAHEESLSDVRKPIGKVTTTGAMMGTPAYMSLEQFESSEPDPRSDQFGFCVALYEALYGERPFAGATLSALILALQEGRIKPAPENVRVPNWLRQVISRGLSRDPTARFPTMDDLLGALRADPTRRRWVLGITLSLVASVVVWLGLQEMDRRQVAKETEFAAMGESQAAALSSRLEDTLEVLHFVPALHYASDTGVGRVEFERFVRATIGRYGIVRTIQWVPHVPAAARQRVEAAAIADGRVGFRFMDRAGPGVLVPSGERGEYFPVLYSEPDDMYLGLDILSVPELSEPAQRARDDARMTSAAPFRPPDAPDGALELALFSPVYKRGLPYETLEERRAAFEGLVVVTLTAESLVTEVLGEALEDPDYGVAILDIDAPAYDRVLFESDLGLGLMPGNGTSFIHETQLLFANRRWSVVFTRRGSIAARSWPALALGIVCIGLLILLARYILPRLAWGRRRRTQRVMSDE